MGLRDAAEGTSYADITLTVITSTVAFGQSLLNWVTAKTIELKQVMGEGLDEDNWKFMCHAVRAILRELYLKRKGGANFRDNKVAQVWHVLKAVQLQNELVQQNFYLHPIVKDVLQQHIKNNVVLKSAFEKFKTSRGGMEEDQIPRAKGRNEKMTQSRSEIGFKH